MLVLISSLMSIIVRHKNVDKVKSEDFFYILKMMTDRITYRPISYYTLL